MATFEEELKRLNKGVRRLTDIALLSKKVVVRGSENFVREGPTIIVGNHIGSYKDVGLLLRIVPRPIFFTANKLIFDKEEFSALVRKHLHRHLGNFGLFVHLFFKPFYAYCVDYISANIARVGSIPVDLETGRVEAIRKCLDYLRKGRAIIALQGRGRVHPRDKNPYIKPFRKGVAVMAHNLLVEDGIDVPVTPLSIFGTHILFGVPARIRANVGKPMSIRDYGGGESAESIEKFRAALQHTVTRLLRESLNWEF